MPWINRIPEPIHDASRCKKPPIGGFAPGSVFECSDCGRHWRWDGMQDDGHNGTYPKWTELLSGASGPTFFSDKFAGPSGLEPDTAWPGLLVNLDGDEAVEKLTAFLKDTP